MTWPVGKKITMVTCLVAFGTSSPAFSQQAAGDDAPGAQRLSLEEVIVTATKRELSVRDIPTSIDAFSGADLSAVGATSLSDIVKLSAGVTMEPGFTPSSSTIQIRGVTNETRSVGPRSVGYFYDAVPLVNPSIIGSQPDIDTIDMQSVEVLKGPQGTLFGGSALAGAVRYVPSAPDYDGFYGSASLGYGTMTDSEDNSVEYTLSVNAPLGDTVAIRFAGAVRDYPGYIDNAQTGKEDINGYRSKHGRVLANWRPTEALSLDLSYLKQTGDADAYSFLEGTDPDRIRQYKYLPEYEDTEVEIFGVRLNWELENASIVFDNNWLNKDRESQADMTYVVGYQETGITVNQNFEPSTDQVTSELRVVSSAPTTGNVIFRDWQYTLGVFYMSSDQDRPGTIDVYLPGAVSHSVGGEFADATEWAMFFDVTRSLTDQWELNLGGRYYDQKTEGGNFNTNGSEVGIPDANTEATLKESGFNPKAALMFHANDNVTLYASAAQGFRFGGINGAAVADGGMVPTTYSSDTLNNYEIGMRTNWLDNRVTADFSAFLIDWEDMQIQQRAGVVAYVDNIGKAEITGFEFSVNAILAEGLSTRIVGAYTDAQTSDAFDSDSSGFIPSGSDLPQAPKWTGSANLNYDYAWADWAFNSSVSYSYRSSSHNNLQNSIPLESYEMVDMAFSVGSLSLPMKPRLSLILKNLTDEEVATFGWSLGTDVNLISMLPPRQAMLRLELEF